jgi:hypothetical protein
MVYTNTLNPDDSPNPETPVEEVLFSDLSDAELPEDLDNAALNRDATAGIGERQFRLRVPQGSGRGVTGGDVDDDWYQAEVVGEEAVGGDNPTPDQNVTEDLQQSAGIAAAERDSVRTHAKLTTRDHRRWELDPASSEDYSDRE